MELFWLLQLLQPLHAAFENLGAIAALGNPAALAALGAFGAFGALGTRGALRVLRALVGLAVLEARRALGTFRGLAAGVGEVLSAGWGGGLCGGV